MTDERGEALEIRISPREDNPLSVHYQLQQIIKKIKAGMAGKEGVVTDPYIPFKIVNTISLYVTAVRICKQKLATKFNLCII